MKNRARERLEQGELCLGMGLRVARTADMALVVHNCDFDFAFIDMEHNAMSVDTATQLAIACHAAGVTPIVRVPGYEHYLATRVLDNGAMGIVFPHVDSAEQARQLVSNCKYPPMGHRSVGSPFPQLGYQSLPLPEATAALNGSTLMVVMLESPAAIEQCDSIAAVAGVDVVLIGTNDLCYEMDIPGQFGHARVKAAYESVIAACRKHNKWPGVAGVREDELVERYIRMGGQFVLAANDISLIMAAGAKKAATLRAIQR
ncbi:MAG: aldolase [Candidatus Lambdaproteobacteria bacterium]|nr:aldolase [Candidatus Lambdaproteobacteria bacterium]